MNSEEKVNKKKRLLLRQVEILVLGIIVGILATGTFFYLERESINLAPVTKLGDTTIALSELKSRITENIKTNKTVLQSGADINITPDDYVKYSATYLNVSENGVIVVRAIHYGQILVMKPKLSGTEVVWKCMGEPKQWIPQSCIWDI